MSYKIRRSLFIGLGGTGCLAVLYCKKRFLEVCGQVPKAVRFLVMDTAAPGELTTAEGKKVRLDATEFIGLQVNEPYSLVNSNPEVRDWFPENVQLRVITAGAGQVRALGRLALFGNAKDVLDVLAAKMQEVRGFSVERGSTDFEVESNNVTVSIVGSLAGGTGSGTFIDIAYLVGSYCDLSPADEVYAYLLLPDTFLKKQGTNRVESNTYAALKELDYVMAQTEMYSFRFCGRFHKLQRAPFDVIMLVNDKNLDGLAFEHSEEIAEFMGTSMWVSSTATGKRARDLWDNIKAQIGSPDTWAGKAPLFSSFGVSEMVFPREWFRELAAAKGATSIASKLTAASFAQAEEHERVGRLVESTGLDTEKVLAEVRDMDVPRLGVPPKPSEEQARNVVARREGHVANFERTVRTEGEVLAGALQTKLLQELESALEAILGSDTANIAQAVYFIETLEASVKEMRVEMVGRRNATMESRERTRQGYAKIGSALDKAAGSMFGKGKGMEKAVKETAAGAREECCAVRDYYHADKSVEAYDFLLSLVENAKSRLSTLGQRFSAVKGDLEREVAHRLQEKPEIKPFLIHLRPSGLLKQAVDLRLGDFLLYLQAEGWRLTRGPGERERSTAAPGQEARPDLLLLSTTELRDFLLRWARTTEAVAVYDTVTIEDILKDLPEEELRQYLKQLYRAASPLWQYDRGLVSGDRFTQTYCILAVPDAERTMIRDDLVRSSLGAAKDYPVESVGDPTRIICYKVDASLPAYVVYDMQRYKDRYLSLEVPGSVTSHTSVRWLNLPDLYPQVEEESRIQVWAMALALPGGWSPVGEDLNLVSKRGQHYYVRSRLRGDVVSGTFRLAQGRGEAFRAFLKDHELVSELQGEITSIVEKMGKTQALALLGDYIDRLRQEAAGYADDVRQIVDKELTVLDKWMQAERSVL